MSYNCLNNNDVCQSTCCYLSDSLVTEFAKSFFHAFGVVLCGYEDSEHRRKKRSYGNKKQTSYYQIKKRNTLYRLHNQSP